MSFPCFFALSRGGVGQAVTKSLSIKSLFLPMPLHVLTVPILSQVKLGIENNRRNCGW